MYVLICEGPCNPHVAMVDDLVKQIERTDGISCRGDEKLWKTQRSLRYTQHVMHGEYRASCMVCGTERQYGKESVKV